MARKGALTSRRRTRVAALQALCEMDCVNRHIEDALEYQHEMHPFSRKASEFLVELTTGVLDNHRRIDRMIAECAPDWPLWQMAMIDRNLLRMAIYEMALWGETPPKVAINEAVEIAKAFGTESSPRFVNGVLGSIMELTASRPGAGSKRADGLGKAVSNGAD